MDECDFVVVGGGSAGYAAARTAVLAGLRTAVIEGGREVGGLCILRGCMPSKTLLESSHRFRVLERAGEFGLRAEAIGFDVPEIVARKRRLIGEFADYRRDQLTSGKFEFIRGRAAFENPNEVTVELLGGGTRSVRSKTFLLSTGSVISRPPIPGLDEIPALDSDEILELERLPSSLIVLGAGPVALEMASYAAALRTRVTIIQRSPQILSGSDPDCAAALANAMRAEGIEIFARTKIHRLEKTASGVRAVFEFEGTEHTVEAEAILNALGREPATAGFEALDLRYAGRRVEVAPTQQTSRPNIFAAGDLCGPLEVVHTAIQQGEVAARNAARWIRGEADGWEEIDHRLKLLAVFSEPQFATVGATERELHDQGIPFRTASYPFADHGKSIVMGETAGFVKLTVHAATGEIVGGSVVGPEASELIHEVVVAMHFRATARQFLSIPHYHPTLSEIWTYPAEELADAGD